MESFLFVQNKIKVQLKISLLSDMKNMLFTVLVCLGFGFAQGYPNYLENEIRTGLTLLQGQSDSLELFLEYWKHYSYGIQIFNTVIWTLVFLALPIAACKYGIYAVWRAFTARAFLDFYKMWEIKQDRWNRRMQSRDDDLATLTKYPM